MEGGVNLETRIRKIRKMEGMSQEKFAEKLGLSKNFINLVESGRRNASDRTISDICRIFNVNEDWLRYGKGEMLIEQSREQQIDEFIQRALSEEPEGIRRRLVAALSKLDESDWVAIDRIWEKLVQPTQEEETEDDFPEDIDAEVEAYRQELLAEKRMREELARDAAKSPISVSANSGEKSA